MSLNRLLKKGRTILLGGALAAGASGCTSLGTGAGLGFAAPWMQDSRASQATAAVGQVFAQRGAAEGINTQTTGNRSTSRDNSESQELLYFDKNGVLRASEKTNRIEYILRPENVVLLTFDKWGDYNGNGFVDYPQEYNIKSIFPEGGLIAIMGSLKYTPNETYCWKISLLDNEGVAVDSNEGRYMKRDGGRGIPFLEIRGSVDEGVYTANFEVNGYFAKSQKIRVTPKEEKSEVSSSK